MKFALRASVSNQCNLNCCYCPRTTSMEDYSPFGLKTKGLPTEGFIKVITSLTKAIQFSSVSLTGGEPLLNKDLFDIASSVRPNVERLELNTNGILLSPSNWAPLRDQFDRVKVSLDSVEDSLFSSITGICRKDSLHAVQSAIRLVRDSGKEVAVNCVVMKLNADKLDDVIAWTKREGVRLHLLDFYYTAERRQIWEKEFIPLEQIIPSLTKKYGAPSREDIFGCKFFAYPIGDRGAVIRLKTSYDGTMRSSKCDDCESYCQEGIFALKLSQKGWVTTCPTNGKKFGVLLTPDMSISDVSSTVSTLVQDINLAVRDNTSFHQFLKRNRLQVTASHG